MCVIWPQLCLCHVFEMLRGLESSPAAIRAGELHVLRPVWLGVITPSLVSSSSISPSLCWLIYKVEMVLLSQYLPGLEMVLCLD